ncbi:hypothetical protein ABIE58_003455 [Roseovarius sp. MBR-78]|jgi:hypothetical protein
MARRMSWDRTVADHEQKRDEIELPRTADCV